MGVGFDSVSDNASETVFDIALDSASKIVLLYVFVLLHGLSYTLSLLTHLLIVSFQVINKSRTGRRAGT